MIDVLAVMSQTTEIKWDTVLSVLSLVFTGGAVFAMIKFQGKQNEKDIKRNELMLEITNKKQEEFRKEFDIKVSDMKEHCETCKEGFDKKYASKDLLDKEMQKQDALLLLYHSLDVKVGKIETSLSFLADKYKGE